MLATRTPFAFLVPLVPAKFSVDFFLESPSGCIYQIALAHASHCIFILVCEIDPLTSLLINLENTKNLY